MDNTTLVTQNDRGGNVTTSLIVAEVFGKEHKNVLRDIETLSCSNDFNRLNFKRITYKDARNREQTAYEMTKDGFSFLVMGYTGAKAGEFKERFINEFNKREALLRSDDYILMRSQQILKKRIADAEAEISRLQLTNEEQRKELVEAVPKVEFHDKIIASDDTCLVRELAKVLTQRGFKIGQNRLYELLRNEGYLIKHGSDRNSPTQPYVDNGIFEIDRKPWTNPKTGEVHIGKTSKVTSKGLRYFIGKFLGRAAVL